MRGKIGHVEVREAVVDESLEGARGTVHAHVQLLLYEARRECYYECLY